MRTLLQGALILLLGAVAGCGGAETPLLEPGSAEPPRRDARQIPPPVVERLLAATPGTVLEANLAGAQTHSYRIDVAAGQYAAVAVDQQGVDVVVELRAPDGGLLRRVDNLNGPHGPEPLPFIAKDAGSYRVEVRSLDAGNNGPYMIVLKAVRPPTPTDRSLVAAEETFAEGEELRRKGGHQPLRGAVEHHRQALAMFRSIGATDREADVFLALGRAYSFLGESALARKAYGGAQPIYRAAGQTRQLLWVLLYLGDVNRILGEPDEALRCLREALSLSRELGARRQEVEALHNLARVDAVLGKADEALHFYEEALAGWRELGDATEEARILNHLGQLYLQLGEVRQAIDQFEDALALEEAAGKGSSKGIILQSLGTAYATLGESRKGIEYLQRALQLHRQAGNRRDQAVVLNELGFAHSQAGTLDQARRYYGNALDIYRALGDRSAEATALLNLGRLHDALGDSTAAVELYYRALSRFAAADDWRREAATFYGLALARRHLGDLRAARAAIEAALERIETLRAEPAASDLRASFFASKQQYFAFYIDLLMELHQLEPAAGHDVEAFEASERVRARSLLEDLADEGERRSHGQLAEEEANLAQYVNTLELRRMDLAASGAAAERLEVVERELRRVLARHRQVRAAIRRGSGPWLAVSQAEPLRLEVIKRQILEGETLLLEYFLGEDRSFLWAVTSTSLESFELPGRATIEAAVGRACDLLPESHRRTARIRTEMALQDLSRLLLAPVGDRLARRRLLVVPDGVLHYLPFAALPVPAEGPEASVPNTGNLVPLVVDHEIVTLPSASTAAVLRQRRSGRPETRATIAVLADPVFASGDSRFDVPQPAVQTPKTPIAVYRAGAQGSGRQILLPGGFPRLPFSHQEAEAILALVPTGQGLGLLGFDASRETALSGKLARYRYVHFATHGILDTAYPELSGLVLSLADRHGRPENGFLRAHEIADLQLTADLVVLSACRTALGKEIRGEGVVGLTRAFLDAGANGVLVSLWQVEDRATAELMRHLYKAMLQEGLAPAPALRRAQLSLWQEKNWRAPYYWAGFALQGEWR